MSKIFFNLDGYNLISYNTTQKRKRGGSLILGQTNKNIENINNINKLYKI